MALNDSNPYQIPQADVTSLPLEGWHEPRSVRFSSGANWVATAWGQFKTEPGTWILMCLIFIASAVIISMIPYVSMLFGLLVPVILAGVYHAARRAHCGEGVSVGDIFMGFRHQTGRLVLLGFLTTLLNGLIVAGVLGSIFYLATVSGSGAGQLGLGIVQITIGLLIAVLGCLVLMATAYAPQLIYLENMSILQALKYSTVGCLRNLGPLTLFSLIAMLMCALGILALGLGMLVVVPILWLAAYASYYDIFVENDM